MNMQDRDGGFTGEPNRNCPLLFKTSSDSINYQFQLYSSDKSDEYAGYLANDLKVEIFNDNSFPIFKADPDFIGTSYAKWIHYIGEDVTPKDITIENGAFDSFAIFGKNHSQKIYFTPKESGTYDILVHDMPDNTTLRLSNLTDQSGSGSYIDIWGNSRRVSGKNFLKFYINMTGGSRYSLSLEKKINGYGYFGTARFNIYLSNRNVLTPTGSSEYGRNYSWRTITYSGMAVNTQFIPTTNGQYTFVLNGSGTEDKDTYIRILDQNFNEIISDDDGWGRNISGAKLNLIANRQYFVISRLYSPNSSGNLEIDVLKQIYFPELQGRILQKTIWLNNMGYVKNMYFLTSQSTNRTIRFGAAPDTTPVGNQPKLSLTIKDTKLYTVANSDDIIASDFVFTFTKDVPYLLEFSLSSYSYTGGINLYVKSA